MKSSLHICYRQNIWVQKSGPIACVIYNVFLSCGTRVFIPCSSIHVHNLCSIHVFIDCGVSCTCWLWHILYMYMHLLARELVFPCLVNCSRSAPLEGYMCLWFVLCCLCSLCPMGHDRHMGRSADSSSSCVCVCPVAGCLLVIYTPKGTSSVSVPVHTQLWVICGLGVGTCKITQTSIAAEALGHCASLVGGRLGSWWQQRTQCPSRMATHQVSYMGGMLGSLNISSYYIYHSAHSISKAWSWLL